MHTLHTLFRLARQHQELKEAKEEYEKGATKSLVEERRNRLCNSQEAVRKSLNPVKNHLTNVKTPLN